MGFEGEVTIVDDSFVWGSTMEPYDRYLVAVLERAWNKSIPFNSSKLEVGLIAEGLKAKIEALKDLRPPTSKSEIHVVLGMANYLGRESYRYCVRWKNREKPNP
jgi:hypothetical protein